MKCTNCGFELPPSSKKCVRCGLVVAQDFDFQTMEQGLLDQVIEDENLTRISEKTGLLYQIRPDEDIEAEPAGKQPVKLVLSVLLCGAVFAVLAFVLQSFSTEYVYGQAEAAYLNCLTLTADEEYSDALEAVDRLLENEEDNLEYLSLKNKLCEKLGETGQQEEVLKKIIELDEDNTPAFAQLLALYVEAGNQAQIVELAQSAPNASISSMFRMYLVDRPVLGLESRTYEYSMELQITCEDGLNIYYTLDGTSPVENGLPYYDPIPLEHGHYTVRAVCRNQNGYYGDEVTGEYQIGTDDSDMDTEEDGESDSSAQIAEPSVYPGSGFYNSPQMITIDVPIGYTAYYSFELGESLTPDNGRRYTGGIPMPEGDSVLAVLVTDGNGNKSKIKQVSYTYQP